MLFAASIIQAQDTKYAGKINGHMISESDFASALWGHYESFVVEHDRKPTDDEWKQLYDKTWENSTKQIILTDAYKKYGISVSEQEVMDSLEAHIPDMILKHPLFQDENGFNREVYIQSLHSDKPIDLFWLRESYLLYVIPQQKLKLKLAQEMVISESDIKNQYALHHAAARTSIFTFYNNKYSPVVTSDMVQQYYHEHLADYARSPQCDIGVSIFPIQPTHNDSIYVRTRIDSIYINLMNGESFQLMASKYSTSVSATKDGDMGYVEIASMPSNAQKSLNQTDIGHFTSPIQLKDSWAIYKVEDKTKNLLKLREIRISPQVGDKTQNESLDKVIRIRSLAEQIGLDKAAAEFDASYAVINGLSKGNPKKNQISFDQSVIERAIVSQPGFLFEPIYRADMHSYLLIQVLKTQPYQELPLEMVQDSIKATLTRILQKRMAGDDADAFYQKYKKQDLITMRRSGRSIIDFENLMWDSRVPTRESTLVTEAILGLKTDNSVTKPVETSDGYFIGYLVKYKEPNWNNLDKEKSEITRQLRQTRMNDYFMNWVKNGLKHARVNKWYKFKPLGETPIPQEGEYRK